MKNKKGFTLIEILIAIAIIGILASIVLVNLNSSRQKSKNAKALAMMERLNKYIFQCRVGGGNIGYPSLDSETGTDANGDPVTICATSGSTETYPDLTAVGWRYNGKSFPSGSLKYTFRIYEGKPSRGPSSTEREKGVMITA